MSKIKFLLLGLVIMTFSMGAKAAALAHTSAYVEVDPSFHGQAKLLSAKLDGVEWVKGEEAYRSIGAGDILNFLIANNGEDHKVELTITFPRALFGGIYGVDGDISSKTSFALGAAVGGEHFYKLKSMDGHAIVHLMPSAPLTAAQKEAAIQFNMAD